MLAAAESDREVADAEIEIIGDRVNHLPIFSGADHAAMTAMATHCSENRERQIEGHVRRADVALSPAR